MITKRDQYNNNEGNNFMKKGNQSIKSAHHRMEDSLNYTESRVTKYKDSMVIGGNKDN